MKEIRLYAELQQKVCVHASDVKLLSRAKSMNLLPVGDSTVIMDLGQA
jgi:hypothetical protein